MNEMIQEQPNGAGLLTLGILSLFLGPITGIPGVIMSKKFRPFTPSASVGYFLCWIGIFFGILAILSFPISTSSRSSKPKEMSSLEQKTNQPIEPIVKTPVDSVNTVRTQAHP